VHGWEGCIQVTGERAWVERGMQRADEGGTHRLAEAAQGWRGGRARQGGDKHGFVEGVHKWEWRRARVWRRCAWF
jgi:hypothetical protein